MSSEMRLDIEKYCTKIGADPLLVQGAGGNISWKDGDTLWVKASGMWMVDALKKDIFVPVNLVNLSNEISGGNYSATPKIIGESVFKPSIETILHALLPHKIVLHLHAVEILACMVMVEYMSLLELVVGNEIKWVAVDYHKPGSELAQAIKVVLANSEGIKIIFLKNHGVVFGGDSIEEIDLMLSNLSKRFRKHKALNLSLFKNVNSNVDKNHWGPYIKFYEAEIQQLALNSDLFNAVKNNWALYPDHIVFLGRNPYLFDSWEEFKSKNILDSNPPDLIFIKNSGVYTLTDFSVGKAAQLSCYYQVLRRQQDFLGINKLSDAEIDEIVMWDAEKYRINLC